MKNYKRLFEDSYIRVTGLDEKSDRFFTKFYKNFLSASPEIREKFKGVDMENQKKMIKQSMQQMLNLILTREAGEYMESIARLHSKKERDIPPYLYDIWLDSLIDTVKDLDPKYDPDIGLAWKMALSMGIVYMKDMYDR